MSREREIKKRLWQFAIMFAITLLALTWAEVSGRLSIRILAFTVLAVGGAGWIFLTISFRKIVRQYPSTELTTADADDPATRKKIIRSLRTSQAGLIVMPLLLLNGLLNAKGAPWISIATGVAANLGLTWLFFKAYQVQRAKLQQLDSVRAANQNRILQQMKADNA